MKAIILAAGKSSRLYPTTISKPKCLLELYDGVSIIDLQIKLLKQLAISDILVVTGYKSQVVMKHLSNQVRFSNYKNFDSTNNLFTLNHIKKELNDDLLILFSDVIIEKKLLKNCIDSPDDFNLIIDTNNVFEHTMRVKVLGNSIIDIGSHIDPQEGDGNFIGIAKISKEGSVILKEKVEELCLTDAYVQDYYTLAFSKFVDDSIPVNYTSNENKYYWKEIDYLKDYEQAKKDIMNFKENF